MGLFSQKRRIDSGAQSSVRYSPNIISSASASPAAHSTWDAVASAYEQLRPYGFILILGLVFLGVFSAVCNPIIGFVQYLLFL